MSYFLTHSLSLHSPRKRSKKAKEMAGESVREQGRGILTFYLSLSLISLFFSFFFFENLTVALSLFSLRLIKGREVCINLMVAML
jgi:hypothetical protein